MFFSPFFVLFFFFTREGPLCSLQLRCCFHFFSSFLFVFDTYPKREISNMVVARSLGYDTNIFCLLCLLIYRLLEMLESILCISFFATLLFCVFLLCNCFVYNVVQIYVCVFNPQPTMCLCLCFIMCVFLYYSFDWGCVKRLGGPKPRKFSSKEFDYRKRCCFLCFL